MIQAPQRTTALDVLIRDGSGVTNALKLGLNLPAWEVMPKCRCAHQKKREDYLQHRVAQTRVYHATTMPEKMRTRTYRI
jgi:hypothetical protein